MTSTKSCNIPGQNLKLFKWTLKQRKSTIFVYSALLLFAFPMLLMYIRVTDESFFSPDTGTLIYSSYQLYNYFFAVIVLLFSIIISISSFSYMHNKRRVDLFGAFPINRRKMFFSRYLASIVITLIPAIIFTVVGILLILPSNVAIIQVLISLLFLSFAVIANISFIGFLAVCCGTIVDTLVSYCIISIVYPIGVSLLTGLPSSFIPGFARGANLSGLFYTALNPCFSFIYRAVDVFGIGNTTAIFYKDNLSYLLWWVVFTVITLTGAFFLSKKRKAESAQNSFAFNFPKQFIIVATSLVVGLFFSAISLSMSSSSKIGEYFWFLFLFTFTSTISILVLNLIYNRGLKDLKSSLIPYGISVLVLFGLFVSIVTGWFGADIRVPDIDKIKSVSFADSYNCGLFDINHSDKEIIEDVQSLHKNITKNLRSERSYPYSLNSSYIFENAFSGGNYDDIYIKYNLKNGGTITRVYPVPESFSDDNYKMVKNILNNKKYNKNTVLELLSFSEKSFKALSLEKKGSDSYWIEHSESGTTGLSNKEAMSLAEAMIQDDINVIAFNNFIEDNDVIYTLYFELLNGSTPYFNIKTDHKNTIKVIKDLKLYHRATSY